MNHVRPQDRNFFDTSTPADPPAATHAAQHAATPGTEPSIGDELRSIFYALTSRTRLITVTTAITLVLAVAYIWLAPPLYRATTEILIDPRSKRLIQSEVVPTGLGSSALGADTLLVDSQVEIILSRSVLGQLITRLDLTRDGEFGGGRNTSWIGQLAGAAKAVVRGPRAFNLNPRSPYDAAMKNLTEGLKVERKGNTYVVLISMASKDPEKAAKIANTIAAIYVDEKKKAAQSTTQEAANSLKSKLDELRSASVDAELRAEKFRTDNGLIGTADLLVVKQKLRDVNAQLSTADAQTKAALAKLQQVRKLKNNRFATGANADAFQSNVMTNLLSQLSLVRAREAGLAATRFPNHPSVTAVKRERIAVENALKAEATRTEDRFRIEYNIAVENQKALAKQAAQHEATVARSNVASVRLRELEAEANANRRIYQAFLVRSKEATEQIDLPTNTARIISDAVVPSRPSSPVVALVLLIGLFLGLFAGTVFAWVSHLLNGTRIPERPGQYPVQPQHPQTANVKQVSSI